MNQNQFVPFGNHISPGALAPNNTVTDWIEPSVNESVMPSTLPQLLDAYNNSQKTILSVNLEHKDTRSTLNSTKSCVDELSQAAIDFQSRLTDIESQLKSLSLNNDSVNCIICDLDKKISDLDAGPAYCHCERSQSPVRNFQS